MSARSKQLYEILARQPSAKIPYRVIYNSKNKLNQKIGTHKTDFSRLRDLLRILEKEQLIKRFYAYNSFYSKKQHKNITVRYPDYIIVVKGDKNELD